jgi:hypothetical protein
MAAMTPAVRRHIFALGFIGFSLCAAPILADPVAVDSKTVVTAPNWIVGSNWYYSDGYALKVTSSAPESTVFDRLDAPGQWFSRQGFLRKDLTSGTATRTSIFRTIPDQAGLSLRAANPLTFQREYLENGALVVHASSWSVEGRETITVPAGTFDCWIIVWRSRSLRSDWTGFERWWYSPQAQNYVRMEYKYGPDSEGSRVLMRYQIGAQAAAITPEVQNSVPIEAAPANTAAAEPAPPPAGAPPADATPPQVAPADRAAELVPAAPDIDTADQPVADSAPAAASPPSPPVAAKHAKTVAPAPAREPAPAGGKSADAGTPSQGRNVWHAQVASSKEEAAIPKSLDKILRSHAELLKAVPSGITATRIGERGIFYRAWLGEFSRSAEAIALCSTLRAGGTACSVSKSARGDSQRMASRL